MTQNNKFLNKDPHKKTNRYWSTMFFIYEQNNGIYNILQ